MLRQAFKIGCDSIEAGTSGPLAAMDFECLERQDAGGVRRRIEKS